MEAIPDVDPVTAAHLYAVQEPYVQEWVLFLEALRDQAHVHAVANGEAFLTALNPDLPVEERAPMLANYTAMLLGFQEASINAAQRYLAYTRQMAEQYLAQIREQHGGALDA